MLKRPDNDPTAYEAGCAGKEVWPSEAAAAQANDLERKGRIRHWRVKPGERELLHPYLCEFCGGWHLGH